MKRVGLPGGAGLEQMEEEQIISGVAG